MPANKWEISGVMNDFGFCDYCGKPTKGVKMKIGDRVKSKMTFFEHHGTIIDRKATFYMLESEKIIETEKFRVKWDNEDTPVLYSERELVLIPHDRPWLSKMQRRINSWWQIREDERAADEKRQMAVKDCAEAMIW